MTRRTATIAIAAVLATAGLASAGSSLFTGGDAGRGRHVTIHGHVHGLVPGAHRKLRARIDNPFRHWVEVSKVRALIDDASAACPETYLKAQRVKRSLSIRPRGTRRVGILVKLRLAAPDECQLARFPLHFTARVDHRGRR